jgi:two-component system, NtrC family, sensor kinase
MKMLRIEEPSKETSFLPRPAGVDHAPEKSFDDLAWLAAQVCCAPMAVVSMAGERGQWVKSKVGLTAKDAGQEFTICAGALAQRRMQVVTDVLQDEQLAHDPLVSAGPKLRFFAGVPLITSDGQLAGTLSVMDRVPRQLSAEQAYALEVLARQLVNQLEWRNLIGHSQNGGARK